MSSSTRPDCALVVHLGPTLPLSLADAILAEADLVPTTTRTGDAPFPPAFRLHVPKDGDPDVARRLYRAVQPVSLELGASSDDRFHLYLGAPDLQPYSLRLASDSPQVLSEVKRDLGAGFGKLGSERLSVLRRGASIRVGAAGPRETAYLALYLRLLHGVDARVERRWPEDDMEVGLAVPDVRLRGLPPEAVVLVRVVVGDAAEAGPLVEALNAHGFARVEVEERATLGRRLQACQGMAPPPVFRRLLGVVQAHLDELGVDARRYPLEVSDGHGPVELLLPLEGVLGAGTRPWGLGCPGRYPVEVVTDEPQTLAPLVEVLGDLGHEVFVTPFDATEHGAVPCVAADAIHDDAAVAPALFGRIEAHLHDLFGGRPVARSEDTGGAPRKVRVVAPVHFIRSGAADAAWKRRLRRWNVVLFSPVAGDTRLTEAMKRLRKSGFSKVQIAQKRKSGGSDGRIRFGGADAATLDTVEEALGDLVGARPTREQAWHPIDTDIFVELSPQEQKTQRPSSETRVGPSSASARRPVVRRGERMIETAPDHIRIGPVTLPRSVRPEHPWTPAEALARTFVVDQGAAEVVVRVAEAWASDEPLLLEGPTSASKTSAVLFVAALLGHPVARLNLDGHADTSVMLGRIAPRTDGTWGWHEGVVPRSMREGAAVVLDELSLAEPAVIERLNPLLEWPVRELVLSEHDDARLRPSEGFRLFATQNPVEGYVGRKALSPAFRDRWDVVRVSGTEDALALAQMVEALVRGGRPEVVVQGVAYRGLTAEEAPALYPELGGDDLVATFLERLVGLQAALARASAAETGPLGSERPEPYVWTRRRMLRVLRDASRRAMSWSGPDAVAHGLAGLLVRHYVEVVDPQDREAVFDLADTLGLGPRTWDLGGSWPLGEVA